MPGTVLSWEGRPEDEPGQASWWRPQRFKLLLQVLHMLPPGLSRKCGEKQTFSPCVNLNSRQISRLCVKAEGVRGSELTLFWSSLLHSETGSEALFLVEL